MVTTKVKTKLFDDNILRGVGISVNTFGGYVTLTGAVDNETQRKRATAIVKSVYGVRKKIISLLTGCLLMMTGRMKKKSPSS